MKTKQSRLYIDTSVLAGYLLHASPRYRVIFEITEENEIKVIDLFKKERLDAFATFRN